MQIKKNLSKIEMSGPDINLGDIKYISKFMQDGWVGKKKYYYVEKFENDFAKFHSRKYGLMTPNCTTAIHLILHALKINSKNNVINQECTWSASAAAVKYTGADNNFVDIDENNWCISPESLKKSINSNTAAIISTNIYGNMPNYDEISKICKKNKIPLIEDAAESLGSSYKGKRAGSFGIASVFSFHRTKTITTGEGGIVLTNNRSLYEKCKFYRDQGRDVNKTYWIKELGFKYMPSNFQGAMALTQFNRLKKIIDKKREILYEYKKNLKEIEHLLIFNNDDNIVYNGAWATTIVVKNKKFKTSKASSFFKKHNVPFRPFFYPLSSMKVFSNKIKKNKNPISYQISNSGMTLPSNLKITKRQIKDYSIFLKNYLKNL